jgi:hypothetical protein
MIVPSEHEARLAPGEIRLRNSLEVFGHAFRKCSDIENENKLWQQEKLWKILVDCIGEDDYKTRLTGPRA